MRTQEFIANGTSIPALATDGAGSTDDSSEWLNLGHLAQGSERVGGMVVKSAQVRKMLETISRIGPYKSTVLIHGESGTGKELVARALHMQGPKPGGPFVTFNCSNLVESLAESQLFGHVRGAFTDAREESLGYFRSANGGTLFLDEIGELPLRLQPKLLRAVENHEVQPVGSSQSYKVDIRLIAATNRDLRAMVAAGQFRDDLYYRLHAAEVHVPPLRERPDSIPGLVAHFIEHHNHLFGKNIRLISRTALDAISVYPWPGNIRQLGHAIESAVLMAPGDAIDLEQLSPELHERANTAETGSIDALLQTVARSAESGADGTAGADWTYSLDAVINEASKAALIRALEATGGNCHRAAELLGVSRYTVYRMLNRFGMGEARAYRGLKKAPGGA
jgi:transcriptional regulator with GAF, ATPase, and Fis domain